MSQGRNKVSVKIGEAANALGVHKDTLRRWEKAGKIEATRSKKGTRLYDLDELKRFQSQISSQPSPVKPPKGKTTLLKIAQASEILGIHKDTLRRWEKAGKIGSERSVHGARLYDISQLQRVEIKPRIKPALSTKSLLQATQATHSTSEVNGGVAWHTSEVFSAPSTTSDYHKDIQKSLQLLAGFTVFILTVSFGVAAFVNFGPQFQTPEEKVIMQEGKVLAATAFKPVIKINADTKINGALNEIILAGTPSASTISLSSGNTTLTVTNSTTLNQDLSTASSPTFAGLTVNSPINAPSLSTSELIFDVSGQTGTISWTPTATRTITLPDATTTLVGTDTTQTLTNKTMSGSSNTFSSIPNSALSNSKVTVSAGTNLTGGGDVSLGSSVTLTLKNSISLSGSLTVSSTTAFNGVTYTWPSADGSSGSALTTNSAGTLSWSSLSSAAGWTDDGTVIRLTASTDNVGIGTTAPASKLAIAGNVGIGISFAGYFPPANSLIVEGNVGVGFSSPASALTVGSSAQFAVSSSGDLTKINNISYSFPSSQAAGSNYVLANDASGNLSWQAVSGVGGISGTGFSGAIPYFNSASAVTASPDFYWNSSSSRLGIGTSSPGGSLVVATGNVGIGLTSPSAKLDVSGTVNISGATVIAPSTDGTTTSLTVRAANGSTGNILNITNTAGSTSYLSVNSSGSLTVGGNTLTASGDLEAGGKIRLTDIDDAVVGTAIEGGWTMNSNTFTYRRPITVTNNDGSNALPVNYEVTVTISGSNASQIYSNTQSDGDDFRIAYNSTEIQRNITTYTSSSIVFTFQLQAAIAASGTSTAYYIYYKNSALTCSSCTYTGNVTLDTMDDASPWTSSDTTQFPIAVNSVGGNTGIGVTATVDNIGTFSTTSQGQLAAARTNFGFDSPTISGTRYLYVAGGSTDGTAANAQTTIYRTSVAAATGNVASWTTNANSLSTALMDNSVATATPPIDGGTGADGAIDLASGGGAGGCTGTGLSWSGSTCTIATDTKSTFNFTTVNIPSGTTLTTDGPKTTSVGVTIKATGNVGIGGTINLAGKGYNGGATSTVGNGPGAGIDGNNQSGSPSKRGGGGGGGYGGAGGTGGTVAGGAGGSSYTSFDAGSGGGGGATSTGSSTGGAGGGGVKIVSNGDITVSGNINATGADGQSNTGGGGGGGGGSGGAVTLQAVNLTVSGTITANGGNGGNYAATSSQDGGGGGGGGGRINLEYQSSGSITGSTSVTQGSGGLGDGFNGADGSAGVNNQTGIAPTLFVLGGRNSSGTAQSAIYYATVTASDGSVGSFSTSATSLPQALFGHTSTAVTVGTSNYIYVIGGNNGTSDQTTVYKASLASNGTISAITSTGQTQLGTGISYHAVTNATIGSTQYIWVIGGLNGSTAQTTVYKGTLDSSGNVTALTTTGQSTLPTALYGHSAFVATVGSTNYLFVIGGMTTGGTRQTVVYKATIDSSGNVGSFTAVGQTQLTTATGNHASFNFTDSSSNQYAYMVGGNTTSSSGLTTVYKTTYSPIDQTTYNLSRTITSTNLSNKNDLQWRVYSSRTGSYANLQFYDATGGWQTCSFTVSSASTWETKTCDITGVSSANKDAVTQLRLAVSSSSTSQWTAYFDNINGLMNAATISNTASGGSAVLGSANLTLNAQGTGAILINYDAANSMAGSGGLTVYNGATTPLLTMSGSGNLGIGIGSTAPGNTLQIGSSLALGGSELVFTAGGNLGIGTTQPGSRLSVAGNVGIGISFANAVTPANGLAIQGNVGIGTTTAQYHLDVAGGARFACGDSTWNSGPVTTCSDVAEVYSSDGTVEVGEVVAIANTSDGGRAEGEDSSEVNSEAEATPSSHLRGVATRSTTPYQQNIIGVYSTSPGILVGGQTVLGSNANLTDNQIPVALSGRTPVKVSLENGPIEAGDYLTSSSTPGVAMKALRPGPVVGKALESFDGNITDTSGVGSVPTDVLSPEVKVGKILAFINVSYADPGNFFASLSLDNDGNLIIPKIKTSSITLDASIATSSSSLRASETSAAISINEGIASSTLSPRNDNVSYDLSDKIASLEKRIAALEARVQQESTPSATLASDCNLQPETCNLNLTPPEILLATSSATLATPGVGFDSPGVFYSEATVSGMLTAYSAQIQDHFKVLGNTTLAKTAINGDLTVDGTLSLSGNSINALSILYLQNNSLSSLLDIFNGKVTIDKNGRIVAVQVQTDKLILGPQVLGESKILTGTAETKVKTSSITEKSKVFITPQMETDTPLFVTDKIIGESFKVKIKIPAVNDIIFDWVVLDSP